ncbi:hypothetical protein EOI86_19480 [Hwanghaeella grinnelliae]|uniref:Double Cache domain-containing protein n=1 Tax=Hwanghaeella grinnelliae TaxID=2500179 RepID=A0A437QKJ1_9PROT|nr:cache domain-containing protein [Hwanghaeella grinnelliae]RVU35016.1 hypothetical protein EOI86_19480 [Hwanghaeella grinnelliae]
MRYAFPRLQEIQAIAVTVFLMAAIFLSNPTQAQDGVAGAKDMVDGAVAAIDENGWPGALSAVPPETWARLEEDLYVFIVNTDGFIVFHPNSRAIGVNVAGARDPDGYAYMQDLMTQLNSDGATGLVEYYWSRPSDGEIKLKRTYARRIGNLLVACGVYVENV